MNAKKSKKVLLLASLSTLAVSTAAVMAISFSNESSKVRGLGEVVEGTVTWTTSTSTKSGSGNKVTWERQSASGTSMYLYTFGQWNPSGVKMFDSKASSESSIMYGMFVKSEAGDSGAMFRFQYITSVTIVTTDSQAGSSYGIYTDSSASGAAVANQVLEQKSISEEEEHEFTTEVEGAHYLAIKPISTTSYFGVKSVTVTYSCEPGGPSEYEISKSEGVGYTITSSKSSATAGEAVSFSVEVSTGYTLNGVSVKKGSDDVEVSGPTAGTYSFIMPYGDVEISTDMSGLHHIAFGYGYKTQYSLGDTFEKPVVYAYYYGSESGETVTDSAIATGYDMNTAGEQTVTVSYTDLAGATVSKQYTITVGEATSYSVGYQVYDATLDLMANLEDYFASSSVAPSKFDGEELSLTLNFSIGGYDIYWVSILEDEEWDSFSTSDGIHYTLSNLPASDITVYLIVGEAS